jgi:hypothetical protein
MELSSHVTANLDQWVENGFIHARQREAIAQLMEAALDDAYDAGYNRGENDAYDDGYDAGYGYGLRDAGSSFDEGYAAAIADNQE